MRSTHALLAFGLFATAYTPASAVEPGAPEHLLTHDIIVADQLQKDLISLKSIKGDKATEAIKTFYAARSYQPVWVNAKGFNKAAKRVMAEIARADTYGLDVDAFDIPTPSRDTSIIRRVEDEVALTRSVLEYAVHARGGRIDPRSLSVYLDRGAYLVPPKAVLAAISDTDAPDVYLRNLQPKHFEFQRLRQKYLEVKAKGEKAVVRIPAGPTLALGKRHRHVALLRERLNVPVVKVAITAIDSDEADDNAEIATPDPETFDEKLNLAVRKFQKENGLKVDGIVGRGTRKVMNGDGVNKLKRLSVNMERWRWMPQDLGNLYVWANIPDYKFYVIHNNRIIHEERIVVGKFANQTATFSDEMEEIVVNPRWNVPNSIKQNEMLPGLLRSPSSLTKRGFVMQYRGRTINPASVDWGTADIRRYHIYQRSGRSNALGRLKFLFPNKHAIYMHDTPSKSLFNRSRRTFSHGCVRVRDPQKFASVLLGIDQNMSAATIRKRVNSGVRMPIKLHHKIPVHITYFTARADAAQGIRYLGDPYKHDNRISLALAGRPPAYVSANTYTKPFRVNPKRRKIAKKKKTPLWAQSLFGWN